MNNTTTLAAAEQIRAFANAVRAQLADLPPDDVEDLVDGLIGDLTDQAADNGGEIELGDPAAYAHELRSAAGLPERGPVVTTRVPWHERIGGAGERFVGRIRSSAFGAWVLDLLLALRPVWWVLRGVLLFLVAAVWLWGGPVVALDGAYGLTGMMLPGALLLAAVLVSVQWGRGRWLPKSWLRHVRTVASVIAILILPVAIGAAATRVVNASYAHSSPDAYIPMGLLLDGVQVGNLFVYDKDGNLIEGAQIYTNHGTPLNLFGGDSQYAQSGTERMGPAEDGTTTLPFRDAQGNPVWNVYPLQLATHEDAMSGEVSSASAPQPPFLRAPARILTTPAATAPPTPTPTPTPTP